MNKIYKKIALFSIYATIVCIGCDTEIQEFIDPIPIATSGEKVTTSGFSATWKPLLGAKSYIIEVATDVSFNEEFLISKTPLEVQDTFFIVGDLEVANTYYYRLLAKLTTGEQTRYSDIVTVNTLGMPKPKALSATRIGPTQFVAQWQKISEAETYEIEVSTDIEFANNSSIQRLITEDTSVVVKDNLKVDVDYFYRILAKKDEIISDYSNIIHLTTTQLTRPIVTEVYDATQTQFTIQWNSVVGAVNYTVEITTDPLFTNDGAFIVRDEVVNQTEYLAANLEANTTYYYRVRANNERSFSEYSIKGKVTTLPLDTPVAIAASETQRNSFRANWQEVELAENYRLEVARDEYFTEKVNGYESLTANDTSVVVTGLKHNTRYYYRVVAQKLNATSLPSNVIEVTTLPLADPVLHEVINSNNASLAARWSYIIGAESYTLDISTDPNFFTTTMTVENIADTLYEVQGLKGNQMYYFRVRAEDGINYSKYSNIINRQLITLDQPVDLTASNITYTGFTASWSIVSDATYYLVDVATDSQFANIVSGYQEKNVNGTALNIEGLNHSTTYYLRVKAYSEHTSSGYSPALTAVTDVVGTPVAHEPTAKSAYGAHISWTLVPDASSYLVDIATDASFASMVSGYESMPIEATYLIVESLQPSTTYYYRVRALIDNQASAYSNTVLVTTDDIPVYTDSEIIEAEDYNRNGGVARIYSADASNKYYLGSINRNDSVIYKVNIPSSGNYIIKFRVSNHSGDSKSILVKDGNNPLDLVTILSTGGWDSWDTKIETINFASSGDRDIKLEFLGGSEDEELLRIDWIEIYQE